MDGESPRRHEGHVRQDGAGELPARISGEKQVVRGPRCVFRVLRSGRREVDWRWAAGAIDERAGDAEFFSAAWCGAAAGKAVQRGGVQVQRAESGDAERWIVEEKIRGRPEDCGESVSV